MILAHDVLLDALLGVRLLGDVRLLGVRLLGVRAPPSNPPETLDCAS